MQTIAPKAFDVRISFTFVVSRLAIGVPDAYSSRFPKESDFALRNAKDLRGAPVVDAAFAPRPFLGLKAGSAGLDVAEAFHG